MKWNKLILKVCKFFGFRSKEEHIDDISIDLPTCYNVDELSFYNFTSFRKNLFRRGKEECEWVIDDIKDQVTRRFSEDELLKKRCNNAGCVFVKFMTGSLDRRMQEHCESIIYFDGSLYYIGLDDKSYERAVKLSKIFK